MGSPAKRPKDGVPIELVYNELNQVTAKNRTKGCEIVAEQTGASLVKVKAIASGIYSTHWDRPAMPNVEKQPLVTVEEKRARQIRKVGFEKLVATRPWTKQGLSA